MHDHSGYYIYIYLYISIYLTNLSFINSISQSWHSKIKGEKDVSCYVNDIVYWETPYHGGLFPGPTALRVEY